MIAACPKCDARYRVDEAKIGVDGARLRCAKCEAVFRVRAPGDPSTITATQPAAPSPATTASTQPAAAPPAAQNTAPRAPAPQAQDPSEPAHYDRERLILVADPREDTGKRVAGALTSWGLQTILVHDGVEAMLSIQRHLPRVVILDAALPKMYGFQVCEVIKRNEALRNTRVILVGAIHNRERYRRPPTELYGADIYLEQPDLPDGLRNLMVQFGLPVASGAAAMPAAPTPAPAPAAPQPPPPAPAAQPTLAAPAPTVQSPAPAAPAAGGGGLDEERAKAERLARIVVSDIVLYQGDKFAEAIRAGNLLQALDSEIEEGRAFFRQRINEQVRNERDHLVEELVRVARERGMQ